MRELGAGAEIITASAADHALVLQMLMQAQQASLAEDFQSRLEEPGYRPSNRLIVRRYKRLLAHVHLANHIAWFDGQRVPVANLEDFAVLPEHQDSLFDRELLAAAESLAAADGAALALVRTERPDWFERQGWTAWRGQGHTRANARAALAHLDAQLPARRRRRPRVEVRLWRHVEADALRGVYAQAAAHLWGPLLRSEERWQWLLGRRAQDQILIATQQAGGVASNGSPDGPRDAAVGYAVVRGSAVAELMTLPGCTWARVPLLAAACREAIDRDHNAVALYTPSCDPLHEMLVTAGGQWISDRAGRGPRWMMRLLSPQRWVERLYELWRQRAQDAGVERPLELGVKLPEAQYRFALTRRTARLATTTAVPEACMTCSQPTFEQLLAGNLDVVRAVGEAQLRLSRTDLQAPLAAVCAPRIFWQSPLESLRL